MTGSMYAAIAGLRSHMSALNVVGNNVANVNTLGYKAARYTFNEALYTTSRSGSDGTATTGGQNPAQIGYGCNVGTIDIDVSTKTYADTGMPLDCMIDGDGFFLVGDKDLLAVDTQAKLQGMNLTRTGDFGFDQDGWLVDGNGQVVYGYLRTQTAEGYDKDGTTVSTTPILTPIRRPMAKTVMEETTNEKGETIYVEKVQVYYPHVDDNGEVQDYKDPNATAGKASTIERAKLESVGIEKGTGRIYGVADDGSLVTIGYLALGQVDNPNGVTHTDGRYFKALGGAGDVHLASFDGAVQYVPADQPDAKAGKLLVGAGGDTTLYTGGLESSGTDLAREITNMITLQRGYQANTRIITVTDSMLEELVNMKR